MKVAIFFDGKNFYSGWRDQAHKQTIDFAKLARWLVQRVGGTILTGCHYYTGVETGAGADSDGQRKLAGFLDMLELQPGYFVYRFARKVRCFNCTSCNSEVYFSQEKEVDTTMVADMLRLAAVNAFDVMILVSGDADYAPAVEGVRLLGKIVFVSSWGGTGLSMQLRKAAFDHIDLLTGLSEFKSSIPSPPTLSELPPPADSALYAATTPPPAEYSSSIPPPELSALFIEQLRMAEDSFRGGYVGANFFVTRWKGFGIEINPDEKRRALDQLVRDGHVDVYEAPNGDKAIKLRR